MAKKQTFQQQLVAFGITASKDELSAALDTLKAFADSRFGTARARKTRSDKGTSKKADDGADTQA